MCATTTKAAITLSLTDLEKLIRRVVREELSRLPHTPAVSILDDWSQEGPDDPAGDEELLAEATALLEQHKDDPDAWIKWEDVEAELDRAEAAGELPN